MFPVLAMASAWALSVIGPHPITPRNPFWEFEFSGHGQSTPSQSDITRWEMGLSV
jgi:hypothetical protein